MLLTRADPGTDASTKAAAWEVRSHVPPFIFLGIISVVTT